MAKAPPRYDDIKSEYALLWETMTVRGAWTQPIDRRAKQIIANRSRYEQVEASTGVPWWMVGAIHSMESGLRFDRHLHNGDSLQKRTWRVPKGRPLGKPPFTWEISADDAIRMKGWHKITDWPIERVLYETERYNGWGYRLYRGIKSPYLWSGCQHYAKGKYIADGKWSSTAVSGQTGAACLMARIHEIMGELQRPVVPPMPDNDIEPEPIAAEDDDPRPIPKAIEPDEIRPVTEAAKSSKTITGGLIALFASIVQWMQDGVQVIVEAAAEVTTLGPAKSLLADMGANVSSIAFGLGVFGIAMVIFRRLDAADKGKIG